MKVYILTKEDRWDDYISTIGVYSTKQLAQKKINHNVKDAVKIYIDKDRRVKERAREKLLYDIEEVELDV